MKRSIYYATRNKFKRQELDIISANAEYLDTKGSRRKIGELIEFHISEIETDEPLEIDLVKMVEHKARSAYRELLAPCIVEHAGLILEENGSEGFPGGLTQPMWDALKAEGFLRRLNASGERAIARSVVGYCDGTQIKTFVAETRGVLSSSPAGSREFYWDVIFCPEGGANETYAQMAERGTDGLKKKLELSQSSKALIEFSQYLAGANGSEMFQPS